MVWVVKSLVIAVGLFVFFQLVRAYMQSSLSLSELPKKGRLFFAGLIANIFDTFGLGSFALIIAMNKSWGLIEDKKIPGTLNGQSILPAMLQSVLFLHFVDIDLWMLFLFLSGACIGGFLCSYVVTKLDRQTLQIVMGSGFFIIAVLLLGDLLQIFPIGGEAMTLTTKQLMIGFPAMILVGMFPAIGAGMYIPTQIVLFLLGLSPLVAFPVMTTTGAVVQATAAYSFIVRKEIAIAETIAMGLAGLIGVAIAVPFITYVDPTTLRWILFLIVSYNAWSVWQTARKMKTETVY